MWFDTLASGEGYRPFSTKNSLTNAQSFLAPSKGKKFKWVHKRDPATGKMKYTKEELTQDGGGGKDVGKGGSTRFHGGGHQPKKKSEKKGLGCQIDW